MGWPRSSTDMRNAIIGPHADMRANDFQRMATRVLAFLMIFAIDAGG